MIKPELLAPVGSYGTLDTVVDAGADSVYLGGKDLNMRVRRPGYNFTREEIREGVSYLHSKGMKVYVTLNSLISQEDIFQAISFLEFLEEERIDGVIIQDLGIVHLAKRYAPSLPLHASTQMNIHNSLGVKMLEQWGVKRVVLARELSLEEIKGIREQSSLELEFFVFGSRCSGYSGQCYLSSSLGGGGGNQGKCSKPCRLLYKLQEDWDYYLSPKDISLLGFLPALAQAGISSFKIEGRMENKEILKEVIATFRYYLDHPEEGFFQQERKLERLLNRSFSPGFLLEKPEKEYFQLKNEEKNNLHLAFAKPSPQRIEINSWLNTNISVPRPPQLALWIDSTTPSWVAEKGDILYLGGEELYTWEDERKISESYEPIAQLAKTGGKKLYLALPSIGKDKELAILKKILASIDWSYLAGFLIGSLGALALVSNKAPIALDYKLNIFNPEGLKIFSQEKIVSLCLHSEAKISLDYWQNVSREIIIWGDAPGMVLESSLAKDYSCPKESFLLQADNGTLLRVKTDLAGRTYVAPLKRWNLIREIPLLKERGIEILRLDVRGIKDKNLKKIMEKVKGMIA